MGPYHLGCFNTIVWSNDLIWGIFMSLATSIYIYLHTYITLHYITYMDIIWIICGLWRYFHLLHPSYPGTPDVPAERLLIFSHCLDSVDRLPAWYPLVNWWFNGDFMVISCWYKTIENHHFYYVINELSMDTFKSYVTNYQRVIQNRFQTWPVCRWCTYQNADFP